MSHRVRALALPLGFALAMAIGACGSGDAQESGATVAPSPLTAQTATTTVPTTTTATTTVPTTTTAPVTTTTAPVTTPTTTQPTTGFTGGARGATTTQPSGGAPAGCPSAVGGFIRDMRATDCGVARGVATAWFDAVHGGAAPDSTIDAAGYSCSGTLAGERASVTCNGSGGSVSFTASP